MNRSDIYADPVKLKARRKKKRKIWFILLESVMLIGILCFAGYSYISSRLDLMQRLPWNPDEIKKRRDFGGEAGADERLLDDRGFRCG